MKIFKILERYMAKLRGASLPAETTDKPVQGRNPAPLIGPSLMYPKIDDDGSTYYVDERFRYSYR